MAALFKVYKRLLHDRPFVTNVITTCTLMSCGDITSQLILQDKERIDLRQTATLATSGLVYVGPMVRGCLVMIDKLLGPTSSLLVLAKKMCLDQLIIAPCFLAGNLTTISIIKNQGISQIQEDIRESYINLLKLGYSFWPFVQVINFYFIPLTYRVVFGSLASFGYTTLFSYRLNCNRRKSDQNNQS